VNTDLTQSPTREDHEKALTEVGFLLDMFASTIHDLMGGATASVSRMAGRTMARKLPVYLKDADLPAVLNSVAHQLRSGYEISCAPVETGSTMTFGKCAIRRICENRGIELHGPLCELFHYYLDGMFHELHCRPVKSTITKTGTTCQASLITK
jgi:hypothetical protein